MYAHSKHLSTRRHLGTLFAALVLSRALLFEARAADEVVLAEDFNNLVDKQEVTASETKFGYIRTRNGNGDRGSVTAYIPSELKDGSGALAIRSSIYSSTSNFVGIGANDLPESSIYTVSFDVRFQEIPDRTGLFVMMGASGGSGEEIFDPELPLTTKGTTPLAIATQSLFALRIGFVGQKGQIYSIGPDGNTTASSTTFRFGQAEQFRLTIVANGSDSAIEVSGESLDSKQAGIFVSGQLVSRISIPAARTANALRIFAQGDSMDHRCLTLLIDNLRVSNGASCEP